MEEAPRKRTLLAKFSDDLIVEFLRRLPVRSVCRCKCVSRSWRDLISHPGHRKLLPQTLIGFFHLNLCGEHPALDFTYFSGEVSPAPPFINPSFSPPVPISAVFPLDSCNGLLLFRCYPPRPSDGDRLPPFHYAVFNPTTALWVVLPDGGGRASGEAPTACLAFDPAVSSHFSVIEYLTQHDTGTHGGVVRGVQIYSSRSAAWTFKKTGWAADMKLDEFSRSVFLHGFMHSITSSGDVIAVDMEGKRWRTIPTPCGFCFSSIHQAQGRLWLLNTVSNAAESRLFIRTLDDYGTDKWILKHAVDMPSLFAAPTKCHFDDVSFRVIAVHPECSLIFYVYGWTNRKLMSYQMDRREVRFICNLGHEYDCWEPYLPYVPVFLESIADGK